MEIESALFITHCDGFLVGTGQLLRVPWVDNDTAVQALGSASKLREDQDTVALLLSSNVLVGDEVHAITSRRNDASIRDGIEGDELIEVDRLVEEVNRLELDRACAIDWLAIVIQSQNMTYQICR